MSLCPTGKAIAADAPQEERVLVEQQHQEGLRDLLQGDQRRGRSFCVKAVASAKEPEKAEASTAGPAIPWPSPAKWKKESTGVGPSASSSLERVRQNAAPRVPDPFPLSWSG
jgi:hypothetical protein